MPFDSTHLSFLNTRSEDPKIIFEWGKARRPINTSAPIKPTTGVSQLGKKLTTPTSAHIFMMGNACIFIADIIILFGCVDVELKRTAHTSLYLVLNASTYIFSQYI